MEGRRQGEGRGGKKRKGQASGYEIKIGGIRQTDRHIYSTKCTSKQVVQVNNCAR